MAHQLSFDLPVRSALGRADFFVAPTNALAVALVDAPERWVQGKLILYGPPGSGKTHLAHVWADGTEAAVMAAADLPNADVPSLATGSVAIEDVPDIAQDAAAQTALFHLHNMILAEGGALVMTGRAAPDRWQLSLPDLQSRISATQAIALSAPDDALLSAVLAKLFGDRQIVPKPDVIPFLVARMDRSFEAAAGVVDALDKAALEQGRAVSRPLAAQVLRRGVEKH